MRIAVITPVFSIAGVPLAQVRFARALARSGHDVDLLIGHIDSRYTLPDLTGIRLVDLKKRHVRGMLFPLMQYLRSSEPQIVFSAEDHLNAIVLLAAIASRSKAKISCSSRVTPFDTYSNTWLSKRWVLKHLMRAVMWRANVLTCVSKDMVTQYQQLFPNDRHTWVYNIVDDESSRGRMLEPVHDEWLDDVQGPLLIAAGRLAPWKGFTDLIRAMGLLSDHRNAKLLILGDGPQRKELQALVERLGLQRSIRLLGYVDNPLKYFARADVFVLSSLVEGLPNVLVEAMMCGCTPVSTDCPTGPKEVLQDGRFGYLVPMGDPAALAVGIERAIATPIPQQILSEAIRPFEEHAVIERHFELLGIEKSAK